MNVVAYVRVQVVANITGRAETVSAALVLAALLCYDRATRCRAPRTARVQHGGGAVAEAGASVGARVLTYALRLRPTRAETAWVAASCAFTAAAVLCKETALVTPALIGVLEASAQLKHGRGGAADKVKAMTSGLRTLWAHPHVQRIVRAIRDALSTGRLALGLAFGVAMLWFRIVFLAGGYQLKFSPVSNSLADAPLGLPRFLSAAFVQVCCLVVCAGCGCACAPEMPLTGRELSWAVIASSFSLKLPSCWCGRSDKRMSTRPWLQSCPCSMCATFRRWCSGCCWRWWCESASSQAPGAHRPAVCSPWRSLSSRTFQRRM